MIDVTKDFEIDVLQQDIDESIQGRTTGCCQLCAIAKAMKRAGLEGVVQRHRIYIPTDVDFQCYIGKSYGSFYCLSDVTEWQENLTLAEEDKCPSPKPIKLFFDAKRSFVTRSGNEKRIASNAGRLTR